MWADEVGLVLAFPSSLLGLPMATCVEAGLPATADQTPAGFSCLFYTLYPGAPALNPSAPGPLHLWIPGLGMFLP